MEVVMEIADAQKFLQENHRACIAVRQRDGWPQMTFVTPGIDPEGRVIITSRGTTYKIKHIRREPRVSMLIFGEQYSGSKFVQIHGTAEIIEQPVAMDTLIYWYKQLRGEHKNWDEYRARMKEEKRVIIRVNIEKVGPPTRTRTMIPLTPRPAGGHDHGVDPDDQGSAPRARYRLD
jgi:PPOX class probable F420-dependent enzyme